MTRKTFRPGFEPLERRDCLSTTLANGTLSIVTTNLIDEVTITVNDQANTVTVVENGVTKNFASSDVINIVASLKASNDNITFKLAGNAGLTRQKNLLFDLGAASDTAIIDVANTPAGLATIRAQMNITVLGGIGFEDVDVRLGHIEDATVNMTINNGNQADDTVVKLLGDLIDSSVAVTLPASDGATNFNDGRDTLDFDASNIKINKDSILNVNVQGGQDRDTLDFLYSGELDGLLKLRMNGGRDKDTVNAQINLDDTSDGTLDAIIRGGSANNDIVTLAFVGDDNEVDVTNLLALQD